MPKSGPRGQPSPPDGAEHGGPTPALPHPAKRAARASPPFSCSSLLPCRFTAPEKVRELWQVHMWKAANAFDVLVLSNLPTQQELSGFWRMCCLPLHNLAACSPMDMAEGKWEAAQNAHAQYLLSTDFACQYKNAIARTPGR